MDYGKKQSRIRTWQKALEDAGFDTVSVWAVRDDENDLSMMCTVDGENWDNLYKLVTRLASTQNLGSFELIFDVEDYQ
jgi:hypothetical protein